MLDAASTPTSNPENGGPAPTPRITAAMQDYLKAVYRVIQEDGQATTQQIAEELGISAPSVTNMVKKLHEFGLLHHTRYQGVSLTPAGERVALEVLRHHRLLELYLTESLGYNWDEVHAEAERLEHHVSEELEARMDAALGYPTRDPHGDPIPSREGAIADAAGPSLLDIQSGESAIVSRVPNRDPEELRLLGLLGLYPGRVLTVLESAPPGDRVRIVVDGQEHALEPALASRITIEHPR